MIRSALDLEAIGELGRLVARRPNAEAVRLQLDALPFRRLAILAAAESGLLDGWKLLELRGVPARCIVLGKEGCEIHVTGRAPQTPFAMVAASCAVIVEGARARPCSFVTAA